MITLNYQHNYKKIQFLPNTDSVLVDLVDRVQLFHPRYHTEFYGGTKLLAAFCGDTINEQTAQVTIAVIHTLPPSGFLMLVQDRVGLGLWSVRCTSPTPTGRKSHIGESITKLNLCMKTLRALRLVWVGRLDYPIDPYKEMKHGAEAKATGQACDKTTWRAKPWTPRRFVCGR